MKSKYPRVWYAAYVYQISMISLCQTKFITGVPYHMISLLEGLITRFIQMRTNNAQYQFSDDKAGYQDSRQDYWLANRKFGYGKYSRTFNQL